MSDLSLSILLSAQDSASSVIGSVGTAIKDLASGNIVGALSLVGTAVAGIGVESVKMAGDFQKGTMTLITSAGESASNLQMVRDGILNISQETGTTTENLIHGMYMIESSGLHGAAGLDALRAAAMGAKAENADLGVVTNAVTTVMTDYAAKHVTAAQAMNALTATVASGKTTLQSLASSMGTVLPLASSLGISFPQVAGALATMTNSGMSAQRASQNLANAIRSLAAPSGVAQKSMQAVGLSAQDLKNTLSNQGLAAAIALVEDHVGKKFPAGSVQAVEAFKAIMGGATGYNVALMVGGAHMKTYQANIDSITKAMQGNGNEIMGWAEVQGTFNVQIDRAKAAFDALLITLGTQLLPVLTPLVAGVAQGISAFANWLMQTHAITIAFQAVGFAINTAIAYIRQIAPIIIANLVQTWQRVQATWGNAQSFFIGLWANIVSAFTNAKNTISTAIANLVAWWNQWKAPIQTVGTLLLVFFTPALIKAGVEAATAGAKIAAQFIANITKTGIEAGVSGAKLAVSFVANIVKSGIEAVTSGAKLAVSFVANVIKTGVEAVTAGAKLAVSFVANVTKAGIEGWASASKLAPFVAQITSSGAQSVTSGAKLAANFVANVTKSGIEAGIAGAKIAAQFVANLVKTGVEAAIAGAKIAAQFVASITKAGIEAAIAGGKMLVSLVPALISVVTEATIAAVTAIPGLVMGFIAWAGAAIPAAAATIAATWPILLLIIAIAGLVAGIIFLATHWQQVWSVISSTTKTALAPLAPTFASIGNIVKSQLMPAISAIGTALGQAGQAFQRAWGTIQPLLAKVATTVGGALMSAWNALWPALQKVGQILGSVLAPILPVIGNILMVIGAIIGTVIMGAIGSFLGMLVGLAQAIATFIQGVVTAITGVVQVISGIIQVIVGIVTLIVDLVTGHFDKLGADLGNIWKGIQTMFQGVWNIIVGLFQASIGTVISFVSGFISTIITFFTNLFNTLVGHSIIPDLVNGIILWIGNLVLNVLTAIGNFVTSIITFFTNLWTLVQRLWIVYTTALTVLILAWIKLLLQNIITFIANIIAFFTTFWLTLQRLWVLYTSALTVLLQAVWKTITTNIQTAWNNIVNWLKGMWTNIQNAIETPFNNAVNFVKGLLNGLFSFVQGIINNIIKTISGIHLPSIGGSGGGSTPPVIPPGGGLATGGSNIAAGWYTVGEFGPETMYVPGGSTIFPHGSSPGVSSVTHNITINVPGRSRNEAQIIANEVDKILARRYKSQLSTISTGGTSL